MPEQPRATRPPFALDRAFRETVLWGFDEPEHAAIVRRVGEILFRLAAESPAWGRAAGMEGALRAQLGAAAEELAAIVGYLEELARSPEEADLPRRERAQCRKAAAWSRHLEPAVEGLRRLAGAQGPEPGRERP